ncbi:hypothetical protein [Candidatus Halobonum tyrrellensis]|nr:hypothetical protein [Candidatus Halobonum tyrrellensis]
MGVDIRDHPDAPPTEELREFTLVPIAGEEIRRRRDDGEELVERNLRESRSDVYVEMEPDPTSRGPADDIGTALYRLVQLFGTPQFPEFEAGTDVGWRDDTTFKYLFRLTTADAAAPDAEGSDGEGEGTAAGDRELPDEWLVTVFDWHTQLGVGVAGWSGDDVELDEYDGAVGLVTLALVTNLVTEPLQCEYEDMWY